MSTFLSATSTDFVGLLYCMDFFINLLCLYLQFAFAADHYRKCCGFLDSPCRAMVSKRTKRDIHRLSQSKKVHVPTTSVTVDCA